MTGAVEAAGDSRSIIGRCSSLTKTSNAAQSNTLGTFCRMVEMRRLV